MLFRGECEVILYSDFFFKKCATIASMICTMDRDLDESLFFEEKNKNNMMTLEEKDIFGLFGLPKMYVHGVNYDDYYRAVVKKKNLIEIIPLYRAFLKFNMINVKVSLIDYHNPFEFVHTSERQFGYYLETMIKFKKSNPKRKVFIPCDGLGYLSMICLMLKIPYRSYESYGIGRIAVSLGIITTVDKIEYDSKEEVIVIANLANYYDVGGMISGARYIVMEENRLYAGIRLHDIKFSTQGRVSTNCFDEDDFVSCPSVVANGLPMVKGKKCVPLSEKAEFFFNK